MLVKWYNDVFRPHDYRFESYTRKILSSYDLLDIGGLAQLVEQPSYTR